MSEYPNIVITNTEGEKIGTMPFFQALEEKAIRRTICIFLVNTSSKLFLQKRSEEVHLYPGQWDQSAGGHVDEGEEPEESAYRELSEELSVMEANLEEILSTYLVQQQSGLYSYAHCYKAIYDGELDHDNWEIEDGAWWSFDEIEEALAETPEQFTEGFQLLYPKLKSYLFPFA